MVGVELIRTVQPDDSDRPVRVDLELRGEIVAAHDAGRPSRRLATRLRWICEVPPMTLWARL